MVRGAPKITVMTLVTMGLVLLLPLLSLFVPFPRATLNGVKMSYPAPPFSMRGVKSGKYQRKIDEWATRGHPLWAWSVLGLNEVVYRLTGEISLDYRTSVQGGNEGYLWQPMYLRSFNRSKKPPTKIIEATFKSFERVQRFFASKNIPLIGVINPNLIALYPELLPEKYKGVRKNRSSYDIAQREIKARGLDIIDTYALLNEKKATFPIRFFEPTGSHWNDVGSCFAVREVGRKLGQAWGETIPEPRCEEYTLENPPRGPERDLVEVANLLHPERLYRPAPYLTSIAEAKLRKPRKILLVGTSFLFGLEQQLRRHKMADSTTLLFYFKRIRRDGRGGFRPFDLMKLTQETLLSYDAIILDVNVAGPGVLGYGFLPHVTKTFDLLGLKK